MTAVSSTTRRGFCAQYASARGWAFVIDAETDRLMRAALPSLADTTGPRLVNEIELILRELEAGQILLQLQDLGALVNIHRAFRISPKLPAQLTRARACHRAMASHHR